MYSRIPRLSSRDYKKALLDGFLTTAEINDGTFPALRVTPVMCPPQGHGTDAPDKCPGQGRAPSRKFRSKRARNTQGRVDFRKKRDEFSDELGRLENLGESYNSLWRQLNNVAPCFSVAGHVQYKNVPSQKDISKCTDLLQSLGQL